MGSCPFCDIANSPGHPGLAWQSDDLAVFADHRPIRRGHMQIVTRAHYETFLDVPGALLADMARLGQRIGRLQKRRYRAPRIGFVFTGNEVPHVHAHVLPLYASDDITSARFRTGEARFISAAEQSETAQELRDLMEGRGDG